MVRQIESCGPVLLHRLPELRSSRVSHQLVVGVEVSQRYPPFVGYHRSPETWLVEVSSDDKLLVPLFVTAR